ncbi:MULTISPECIES: hypothetical protein [Acetobacter]|uniref:Uncharacterized protein n=1 Tax=Acetobacter thailandicus TaxID=1502842 RepID=A0ABT3QCD4_9PROT|nr:MULTISPECIES: hypothetical protein [Acetobacter]MBS0986887.1 hypothetical protein [Acetobacter thailandicus]MBS1003883.1 hypothetical protein [Acetobacter thailandicus]MCX2562889.1 hypothetical protein [Acetobacter thailandicus]NHN95706.1 hypothetical protein [Acetobacter thailandicus]OUJ11828.1 hypothetical protein HK25_11600 [Acetobacter sp. DsW_059]
MATATTVTVGCKLPGGLVLRLRDVTHTLAGANTSSVIGGYGLTRLPADFWQAWAEAYAHYPLLRQGLIFAQSTAEKGAAQAREQAELRSGLEAVNPHTPAPGISPV